MPERSPRTHSPAVQAAGPHTQARSMASERHQGLAQLAADIAASPRMAAQRKQIGGLPVRKRTAPHVGQAAPGAVQMKGHGVVQKKSRVENFGQNFTWGSYSTIVGHGMKAWLEPGSLLQGESANLNVDQDQMMNAIRVRHGIHGGDLVKGHLLNDNLGGRALNNNLFPITRAANKQHLMTTENWAKDALWTQQIPIWYTVEVLGQPDVNASGHEFKVALGRWAGGTDYSKMDPAAVSGNITSHLGAPKDYAMANSGDMDTFSAETLRKAVGYGMALTPRTTVGGMSADEQKMRAFSGQIKNYQAEEGSFSYS